MAQSADELRERPPSQGQLLTHAHITWLALGAIEHLEALPDAAREDHARGAPVVVAEQRAPGLDAESVCTMNPGTATASDHPLARPTRF